MMYLNCISDAFSTQATPWPDYRHSGLHQATLKSESAWRKSRNFLSAPMGPRAPWGKYGPPTEQAST